MLIPGVSSYDQIGTAYDIRAFHQFWSQSFIFQISGTHIL